MRRKLDHLPRGVKWAVRILRFFGTVFNRRGHAGDGDLHGVGARSALI